jgi:elongation factor 1-gamma
MTDFAVASQNAHTTLLGSSKQDNADILHWMSFGNSEVLVPLSGWFAPLIGRASYVKSQVAKSRAQTLKAVQVLEDHLLRRTFLVGERVTLADLFVASIIERAFEYVLDRKWREEHPNVTRWFETVHNVPCYAAIAGEAVFIEEAIKVADVKAGNT